MSRRRIIGFGVIGLVVLLLVAGRSLLGLRVDYLFLANQGHSNVFWTPMWTQFILFVIGFLVTGLLVAVNIPAWRRVGAILDEAGAAWATGVGIAVAVLAALIGGGFLAGEWQQVLLWLHGHSFGASDPVFGQDYSFYVFTLPVIDAVQAIGWGVALVALLSAIAMAVLCVAADLTPKDVPLPLRPPEGHSPSEGVPIAMRHSGIALVFVLLLAGLGAHFGAYHLTTSNHDNYNFVGLDATQRNVVRPVLGVLQWLAAGFAVLVAVLLVVRWKPAPPSLGGQFTAILVVWLVIAGVAQTVPAAIYQGASVDPNAAAAQASSINDYLASSRYAWGLQASDVEVRGFNQVSPPTLNDLAADPGTLRNVRLQDTRQLQDTLAQIDRTRNYQNYPTITVDRYKGADGSPVEVMLGPREINPSDLPTSFVNQSLQYTHGYGITAVSVNQIGDSGKPLVLAGQQPLRQVAANAPPDLTFRGSSAGDPRIYCGLSTTQPVVVNTTTKEFDYPSAGGDKTSNAGAVSGGIPVSNAFDRLALSLVSFSGLDLMLTNGLTADSRALLHRTIADRIQTLAPFLKVDGDPYVVVDPETNHLMYVADAYVSSDQFPEAYRSSNGTSYMRNAVKAVVDAKTCETTLYALDLNEPMTATYNDMYPGLMTPFDQMPVYLKEHLRYPEDLLTLQSQVYATVHVTDANVFFNGSDRYRLAQEVVDNQTKDTQAYYVQLSLPNDPQPSFVLLQTFSPASGNGGSTTANNMTAWLAAECDYTKTAHPKLVAVPLNNGDNVLGPLQFDNNINTNPDVSKQLTLLGQGGSRVILGNVIVLPFNNHSFLYVRPLYVAAANASGSSFPQLQFVIVGTQNAVAFGDTFPHALQSLFATTQPIPGLVSTSPNPGPSPSPNASPSPGATPTPAPQTGQVLTAQEATLLADILTNQQAADAAFKSGDYAAFGQAQQKISSDSQQLRQLLGAGAAATPSPAPAS